MAGRFSFSVPERRYGGNPWFRLGQIEVTTAVLVAGLCVLSMFAWSIDEGSLRSLVLFSDDVRGGQVWRLVTWLFYNEPSIWTVITIAILWYFGRELEGILGRARFGVLLLLLTVVPGIVATFVDSPLFGIELVQLGVFLVFVSENPFARFFFGIPGWVIGAVIVGIQFLQYLGDRREDLILVLIATIATAGITARTMGLAQSLPWIPALPIGQIRPTKARRAKPSRRTTRGGGDVVSGPWSASGRSGPSRVESLPQPPVSPDHLADQAALDHLLDKISAAGMDGLSADEKRRLNELSKRMRGSR